MLNILEIEIVTSIAVAKERLLRNPSRYCSLIVDCKMDLYDSSENGAEFLLEVNNMYKYFPTYVYSGFLGDAIYKDYIEKSYAILSIPKQHINRPLYKNKLFKNLYNTCLKYNEIKDFCPERITFKQYKSNPTNYSNEIKAHWTKHGHWINIELNYYNKE